MPRKNESILDFLMVLPWWVSVVTSALAYWILAILVPSMEFENALFKGIATGAPQLAPVLALMLLVPAPISAFNSWRKRKLLDTQKGVDTIRELSWREFEELVAEAYRRQGYQVIENNRGGADGGHDGNATRLSVWRTGVGDGRVPDVGSESRSGVRLSREPADADRSRELRV